MTDGQWVPSFGEKMGARAHMINLLSQRTEMPLAAISLQPKNPNSPLNDIFISLCVLDKDGNAWLPSGKTHIRKVFEDDDIKEAIEIFFDSQNISIQTAQEIFKPSIAYISIKDLQEKGWFSGRPGPKMLAVCSSWVKEYMEENEPPIYPGLSVVHDSFFEYLQKKCWFYALALGGHYQKKPFMVFDEDRNFIHSVILHSEDTIEDIWGRRSLSSLLRELPDELTRRVNICQSSFTEEMLQFERACGKNAIRDQVRVAREIMYKNPMHSINPKS